MGGSKWATRAVLGVAATLAGVAFKERENLEAMIPSDWKPVPEKLDEFNIARKSYCDDMLKISKALQPGDVLATIASWSGSQTYMVEMEIKTGPNGEKPKLTDIIAALEREKLQRDNIAALRVDGALSEKDLVDVLGELRAQGGNVDRLVLKDLSLEGGELFRFLGQGQNARFVQELSLSGCTLGSPDHLKNLLATRISKMTVLGEIPSGAWSVLAQMPYLQFLSASVENPEHLNEFIANATDTLPLLLTIYPAKGSRAVVLSPEQANGFSNWAKDTQSSYIIALPDSPVTSPESSTSQTAPEPPKLGLLGATSK
jgi:hypothetical protein